MLCRWAYVPHFSCAQLEEGVDLARALASCPFINAQAQARLLLSQHNAHTDHTFFTMARTEEQALDQQLAKLTQKLEPCLMLIMAVLVGSLVLAIYLPIFNLGAMM